MRRRMTITEPVGRWDALADYNAAKWRGIQHTPEYEALMRQEQGRFDAAQRQRRVDEGYAEISPGLWMRPCPPSWAERVLDWLRRLATI